MGIGAAELVLLFPMVLISLAIPIATLIIVFLVYGKVKKIEQKLDQHS